MSTTTTTTTTTTATTKINNGFLQVLKLILQNVLLPPPSMAPPLIRQLLDGCWKTQPSERMTFAQISQRLGSVVIEDAEAEADAEPPECGVHYFDLKHVDYQETTPAPPHHHRPADGYLQPLPDTSASLHFYANSPPASISSDHLQN